MNYKEDYKKRIHKKVKLKKLGIHQKHKKCYVPNSKCADINRDDIQLATKNYLERGNKITRLPDSETPTRREWIHYKFLQNRVRFEIPA